MNRGTIVIDVDDVVLNLVGAVLELYNLDYSDNLNPSDIHDWNMDRFVKEECGTRLYDYFDYPYLYSNVSPISGSVNGIKTLRELDYRVVFGTATYHPGKIDSLKYYGLIRNDEDWLVSKDKSLICGNYLLDDNPTNINRFRGIGIVFTQAWNMKFSFEHRVNNWKEVTSIFGRS